MLGSARGRDHNKRRSQTLGEPAASRAREVRASSYTTMGMGRGQHAGTGYGDAREECTHDLTCCTFMTGELASPHTGLDIASWAVHYTYVRGGREGDCMRGVMVGPSFSPALLLVSKLGHCSWFRQEIRDDHRKRLAFVRCLYPFYLPFCLPFHSLAFQVECE